MDLKNEMEIRAYAFAKSAHESIGQVRKYTNLPYMTHPIAVARLLASVSHTSAMLCAALLHDVVEDTPVTIEDVRSEFGNEVADLVAELTNVATADDGLRHHRKAKNREHSAKASPKAKTIKLCDVIDNCESIVLYDPAFAKVYLPEKELLLEDLKEGDAQLWHRANSIIQTGLFDLAVASCQLNYSNRSF